MNYIETLWFEFCEKCLRKHRKITHEQSELIRVGFLAGLASGMNFYSNHNSGEVLTALEQIQNETILCLAKSDKNANPTRKY